MTEKLTHHCPRKVSVNGEPKTKKGIRAKIVKEQIHCGINAVIIVQKKRMYGLLAVELHTLLQAAGTVHFDGRVSVCNKLNYRITVRIPWSRTYIHT